MAKVFKKNRVNLNCIFAYLTSTSLVLVQALPLAASTIDQDAASLIKKEQPSQAVASPPPLQQDPPAPPPPPAPSGSGGSGATSSTGSGSGSGSAPVQPAAPSSGSSGAAPAQPATPVGTGSGSSGAASSPSAAPVVYRSPSGKAIATRLNFVDVAFGVLAKGDPVADNRYYHTYYFEGKKDQAIALQLVGSRDPRLNLNPVMFLYGPNSKEPIARRFGGENTEKSAFLQIRLPEDGTYALVVTSREPRKEGRYSLALRNDRTTYLLDDTNDLTDASPRLKQDDSSFQSYEFQGKQGQYVNIRADSLRAEFSPSVYLINSKREVLATSTDANNVYSALIERTQLPADDTYYIVVNSARSNGRGKFRVSLY